VTRHLGFEPFADEYKVMGLGGYGERRYAAELAGVLHVGADGRYVVDRDAMQHLERVLGPRRRPGEPLQQRHMDIAHSAQAALEDALHALIRAHVLATGSTKLCLAGGTFLNCVANGRLAAAGYVDDIFVQPASHDAGTAVGAAALSWVRRGGEPQLRYDSMALGTSADPDEVRSMLDRGRIAYRRLPVPDLTERLSEILARGGIGALFRGRMEFGPRALGMRSIVASPVHAEMRDRLNALKEREPFRPLSPFVTEEDFPTFFDGFRNRYMLFTVNVKESARARIPAVTHVDSTARAQVVRRDDDPFLHALLTSFGRRTGVPVLINTSFNVRGKPIVEDPAEALGCALAAGFDFLLIDEFLIERDGHGSAPTR
jgi:carbamoyltransferase